MSKQSLVERVPPRHLADRLLSHGQSWVDLPAASSLMGLDAKAAAAALVRLRRSGQLFSPSPGFYVPIPPEFRTWGVIPALDFIDPLMKVLAANYYVALLSAAEIHGAAHQRPQAFQVAVDKRIKDRDLGRVKLRFYYRSKAADVPFVLKNSASGVVRVSSPAATALDLAHYPKDGGGLSNVATVVAELVEAAHMTAPDLIGASRHFPGSSLRRLGWVLDCVDAAVDRDSLAGHLEGQSDGRPTVLLDPRGPRRGPTDNRWGLVINTEVEPDL